MVKIGDRVIVNNRKLKSYLQKGIVVDLYGYDCLKVKLDSGKYITAKDSNLHLLNTQRERIVESQNESSADKKHLAFLYLHDEEENPKSLEEATLQDWDLSTADAVFYGTMEEIKEALKDSDTRGYEHWDCAFVIIDSKLFPIEFKTVVNVGF